MLAALAGIHVTSKLKSAGFVSPRAPSQLATNRLDTEFGGTPNLVLLVRATSGTVDQPAVANAGRAVAARVAASPGVTQVTSYWATSSPALRSRDATEALVLAHVAGDDNVVKNRTDAIEARVDTTSGAVTVRAGGLAGVNNAVGAQIAKDLGLAESIAIPATMVLLILAFGSVVAAALPVAIGLVSILATLAVLWILGSITDVSIYALNLTTAMSLGLAIDYSLLMVNRYREELAAGYDVPEAVTRSVATAGRTILFSAATVAAAMAALLVFPVYFLRSFAYAGISVVALATVGALVILPALLAVLGRRVDAVPVRLGSWRPAFGRPESPFWRRVATAVMRRPVAAAAPVVIFLVVLGLPFTHVRFGTPDDRVLPTSAAARQVGDALRTQFTSNASDTLDVVTTRAPSPLAAASYATSCRPRPASSRSTARPAPGGGPQLAPAPGIAAQHRAPSGSWFSAVIRPDPLSGAAQSLVSRVRGIAVPDGATSYVGGRAAVARRSKARPGQPAAASPHPDRPDDARSCCGCSPAACCCRCKALVLNVLSLTRGLRRHGLDLPGRSSVRPAGLHPASRRAPPCPCCSSASPSGCRWTTRSSCSRGSRSCTTRGRPTTRRSPAAWPAPGGSSPRRRP